MVNALNTKAARAVSYNRRAAVDGNRMSLEDSSKRFPGLRHEALNIATREDWRKSQQRKDLRRHSVNGTSEDLRRYLTFLRELDDLLPEDGEPRR